MVSRALFKKKRLLVDYLNRPAYSVGGILNTGYGESSQFLGSRGLSSVLHNSSTHINHEDSRPGLLDDKNELLAFSTTHFCKHSSLGDATKEGTLLSRGIRWMSQSLPTASITKVGQGRSDSLANVIGLSNWNNKLKTATLWVKHREWLDLIRNNSVSSFCLSLSRTFYVSGKIKPEESVQATLSSLPDKVVDTVGVTALPSEDSVSARTRKLESVRKQDELIKSVSRERNGFLWMASLSRDRGGGTDCLRGYSTDVDHPPLDHYFWRHPPPGTLKANTAVSYKKDEWSSIGVVFRDHYGVHDCSLFDTSDGDALDAKYDAIIAAQEFAIERGIKSLTIESDCLHLVNALKNNSDPKIKVFTAKERKIKLLEEQFDHCDYNFIIKEGNSPAKIIAGLKLKERKVFYKPSDIEEIDKREFFKSALQADGDGTIYIQKKKLKKILGIDEKLSSQVVSGVDEIVT